MASGQVIGSAFLGTLTALTVPVVIRAEVLEGFATATEVSMDGALYALIVAVFTCKQFDWKRFGPILVKSSALSDSVMLIASSATAMAWARTQSGLSHALGDVVREAGGKWPFIAISIVISILPEGLRVIVQLPR